MEWLFETWKYVQEDRVERYRMLMAMLPLARTPMDKKGANAMKQYGQKLERHLDNSVPWQKASRRRRETLRGKLKPGEVVVLLDVGEKADDPVFKDARVIRE